MTGGYVLASLIFLGGIITATLGELVNEEIRGWLDYLPRFILRLAAARLDPAGKITIYEDEWLPELAYMLRGAEARPISRLVVGVRFSIGMLIAAKRTARHLHRSPASSSPSRLPLAGAAPRTIGRRRAGERDRAGGSALAVLEAHVARIADNRADAARCMQELRQKLNDPSMRHTTEADSLWAQLDHLQHRDASLCHMELTYRNQLNAKRAEAVT